ncbi:MAG TPA: hypothetical protein VMW25_04730 [Clostridia bacterium]|nr:hypothetical protein [Clostridia bacterium]
MDSDNPTTVRFTEKAKPLKDELAPIYGLKNIVSAGVLLFYRLSDSEQKKAILEANESIEQDEIELARSDDARALEAQQRSRKRRNGA